MATTEMNCLASGGGVPTLIDTIQQNPQGTHYVDIDLSSYGFSDIFVDFFPVIKVIPVKSTATLSVGSWALDYSYNTSTKVLTIAINNSGATLNYMTFATNGYMEIDLYKIG